MTTPVMSRSFARVSLAVLMIVGLLLRPSMTAEVDWAAVLANDPKNQTALHAMGKTLQVPPELVHTRLHANRLLADSQATFASESSFYSLIACLEALGEFSQARKHLAASLAAHPKTLQPILAMAYDHYLEGTYQKAIPWYEEAIRLDPQALDGYHGKMLCLMALEDFDQALAVGRDILSVSPGNFFAALRTGNILYGRGEFRNALSFYSLLPDQIDFQLGMGLCYFRLGNLQAATPLLRAAVKTYPQNQELLSALRVLNEAEIQSLLQHWSPAHSQASAICQRLADLYERNGEYAKAVEFLWRLASRPPQFEQLIRIAADEHAAGNFQKAGDAYLAAISLSPDPWTTSLAAVDCLLLAGDSSRARDILLQLQRKRSVKELWSYFGRLCFLTKDTVQGKKYFDLLGAETERLAATLADPRASFLYAIDCYLDAGNLVRAKAILDRIQSFAPGSDLDRRFARYYADRKEFSLAIPIYSRFPDDPVMQNAKGWAYVGLGDIRNAERTFQGVLKRFPGNAGAKAGLEYTDHHRPWEIFLGYTGIAYGGYRDDRALVTQNLRFAYKKTTTTLSHTRTDVRNLRAGNPDFNEDLVGGRFTYQANRYLALQLHGMTFRNDDADTDGSSVFGGKLSWFPHSDLVIGAEVDSSQYNAFHGTQLSPFVGYRFSDSFRADAKALFTSSGGSRMRASQPSAANGGVLSGTYTSDDRFVLTLGGQFGSRRQAVDGDSLYAFNTLDLYKEGLFARFLYRPATRWKLYLSYSMDRFESELRSAANEAAGTVLSEPRQTSQTVTGGGMFSF